MRLALLSDIHGNIPALQAVVADLHRRDISEVINLGDHVSGPLWPRETVQYLMKTNWIHISGNHDRQLVKDDPQKLGLSDLYAFTNIATAELKWLSGLPAQQKIGNDITAFHGSPRDDQEYLLETISNGKIHLSLKKEIITKLNGISSKIFLCGHSHTPRCIKIDETTIINPGSVGLQGYIDDGDNPHIVEIGSPHARYAIIEMAGEEITIEFIALQYDWGKAAAKAQEAGRKEWMNALYTGYVS
ncbi:MAG: metallophosphoesterase family protein [Candidatus Cloacimonetes bacterium]|nr:metallophosphoesterase family protein [Candidatus Cloacimonadota bacterium]